MRVLSEAAGSSVGVYGGGNTIHAAAGTLTVIGNTNGNFDTVNANGDQIGGTTANGQPTGIWLNNNVQANVNGSNNGISEAAGDSVGVYGGGNVVNTGAGTLTVLGNTNGNADTVYANGVQAGGTTANGQSTGIQLNDNAQAYVVGSNNNISTANNDALAVSGNSNTIYTGAHTALAVNGTGNTINSGSNSVVLDNGANNKINATNSLIEIGVENEGKTVYIYGNGNYIDTSAISYKDVHTTTTIVVRGTGNTIFSNPGATLIDLHTTQGNFVNGKNVAVQADSMTDYVRNAGSSYSVTMGPLAGSSSNTFINGGGDGGSASSGAGGYSPGTGGYSPTIDPWYHQNAFTIASMDTSCSSYIDSDGNWNICVTGGGGLGATASPSASFDTATGADATSAISSPDDPDAPDSTTPNAADQDQDQTFAANTAGAPSTADAAVQSLIAALASFGSDSSVSSTLSMPAQNDSQLLLAASAY
jgi:hypothetical protein